MSDASRTMRQIIMHTAWPAPKVTPPQPALEAHLHEYASDTPAVSDENKVCFDTRAVADEERLVGTHHATPKASSKTEIIFKQ